MSDSPSIWVGSWADYNAGILHGRWIDAARDEDELAADVAALLADSPTARQTGLPAEDWGIFDFEGFAPLKLSQQSSLAWVARVAQGIAEHGPAFAAYAANQGECYPEALDDFEDAYRGQYDSAEAYADELVESCGYDELLDSLNLGSMRPYVKVDVEALARDMEIGGDIWTASAPDGGVYVFDANV